MSHINGANLPATKFIIKQMVEMILFRVTMYILAFFFYPIYKTDPHLRAGKKINDVFLRNSGDAKGFPHFGISLPCKRDNFFRHPNGNMASARDRVDDTGSDP